MNSSPRAPFDFLAGAAGDARVPPVVETEPSGHPDRYRGGGDVHAPRDQGTQRTAGMAGQDAVADIERFEPPLDIEVRLANLAGAANPLLEAAQPLLRALADMPSDLPDAQSIAALRALLNREVSAFQRLCDRANLPWKHTAAARYCLCTALDEAANRTNWGGGGVWASNSLLIAFEGEIDGGEKFFLLIGRMASEQQEYVDVLEVLYRILGLGFEGRYSVVDDGRRHLERIRQRLLTLISGAREAVAQDLSPHWRGEATGHLRLLRSIPVWTTVSVLGLMLFGLFGWYKYQLLNDTRELERRIAAIGKTVPPRIELPKLSILLRDEIERGVVTVVEEEKRSVVTFKGDNMFVPGKSAISAAIEPSLSKVAREVARFGGRVAVIGHTDNQPIHTIEYPDNQILSEKRAALIAQALSSQGVPADRIETSGKGDAQPLAANATPAGRARNRRVEIVVTQ